MTNLNSRTFRNWDRRLSRPHRRLTMILISSDVLQWECIDLILAIAEFDEKFDIPETPSIEMSQSHYFNVRNFDSYKIFEDGSS